MKGRLLLFFFVIGTLHATRAFAWPVHAYVDVEAGDAKILPLRSAEWAEVKDAQTASAELLSASGEVLVTGHAPGRTVMLFSKDGVLHAWRIRVWGKGEKMKPGLEPAGLARAQNACPGLTTSSGKLAARVKSPECRSALLELFQTDDFRADQVELTFDVTALQAQARALDVALASLGVEKPEIRYLGAGLVLRGKVSPAGHRHVLWQVFLGSIGGLALDDQLEPLGEGK